MTSAPGPSPRRRGALPDRRWLPAVAALALAMAFVGVLLVKADGDVSRLVHAAPPWTDPAQARDSLTVQPADEAFDGQFFYRLGVSPWTTEQPVAGVTDDLPSLRNARWGYGATAWLLSAGDPDLVPWSLVAINVVAAGALGWIGGGLARELGHHPGWGLVFVLWPGFAYSLSFDTSELLAMTFALGALLALRHRRWAVAAVALGAAVLTRDTTAAVAFGVAASALVPTVLVDRLTTGSPEEAPDHRSHRRATLAVGGSALALFVVWQFVQRARFGVLPLSASGDNNLAAPLTGLADLLRRVVPPSSGAELFRLIGATLVVGVCAAAGWSWLRTRATWTERVAWVGAVGVVLLLNAYLWSGATAFLRASTEAGVLSALVVMGSGRRWAVPALGGAFGAVWLLVAVSQVAKLG